MKPTHWISSRGPARLGISLGVIRDPELRGTYAGVWWGKCRLGKCRSREIAHKHKIFIRTAWSAWVGIRL